MCNGKRLVKLCLRIAKVATDAKMATQHRFHALAQSRNDRNGGQFAFLVGQHIALKEVGKKKFFQESLNDWRKLGISGFGRNFCARIYK